MVVAILVVAHGGRVHDGRHDIRCDDGLARAFPARFVPCHRACGRFENRQAFARIATRHAHDFVDGVIVRLDFAL